MALDSGQNEWLRAGAAYWAARSAIAAGSPETAPDFLRIAARSPSTFYGMIAERQLGIEAGADPDAYVLAQAGFAPAPPSPTDGEVIKGLLRRPGQPAARAGWSAATCAPAAPSP
ncbi:MAG: hypothetical protein WDM92_15960 [Caulobacteraceae bacterium]